MPGWLHRILHPGEARRVYGLDHAHTHGETRRPHADGSAQACEYFRSHPGRWS